MYGLDPGWYTGDVFSLYVADAADDDDAKGLRTTSLAARGGATSDLGALLEGGLPSRCARARERESAARARGGLGSAG